MLIIIERKKIADGIYFNRITDKRFKVNKLSVDIYTDFSGGYSRADYAVVPYILVDSCAKYPDYSCLSRRFLELYGASMSDNTSPYGDCRSSGLAIICVDDRYALEGEKLEAESCQLLLDCLLDPLMENGAFSADTTRLMQGELIDSIESVFNDKRSYAMQRAMEHIYKGEDIGPAFRGTREEAERITPETAYGAYMDMLTRGRIEINAVGYSDFADSEKLLTEAFVKLKRGEPTYFGVKPSPLKSEPLTVTESVEMNQAILRMGFKAPELSDRYAGLLLSAVLGGSATSRFFTNIREKQSLCYYCGCSYARMKKVLHVSAGVAPENIDRTREAIIAEIKDVCENGVTEEELSHAKLELINDLKSIYDSVNTISHWYIGQLMDDEMIDTDRYIEYVEAVTPERVQAACREFALDTVYILTPEEADDVRGD